MGRPRHSDGDGSGSGTEGVGCGENSRADTAVEPLREVLVLLLLGGVGETDVVPRSYAPALLARYGPSDNPNTSSYEHAWDTPTSLLFCVRGEFPSVVLADLAPRDEAGRRSTKQSGTGVKEQ